MKFLTIAALTGSVFQLSHSDMPFFECGETKVPSHELGICIRPNYIQGCQNYLDEHSCASCSQGYELKEGYCNYAGNKITETMPGCLATDFMGKCQNCANGNEYFYEGFRRVNGKCELAIKNCALYNKDKTCRQCQPDYSLLMGTCRHNLLLGCKRQKNGHFCEQCQSPFVLMGKYCDIAHCKKFNDFGCVGCECGYYLTDERDCKQMQKGCLRYSKGKCIDCLSHYKLKGGQCKIEGCVEDSGNECKRCGDKFQLTEEGGCKFPNCEIWQGNDCLVCENGYAKHEGECKNIPESYKQCYM